MASNVTSTMVMNVTMNYFSNATAPPQTSFQSKLWLASLVINFTLLSVSAWMVINIGLYGIRSGKFRRNKKKTLSEHFMLKVLFTTAILMFPRILTTQAMLWIGYESGTSADRQCELVNDFSVGLFYLEIFPIGLFLWLRQRSLYLQPSLLRLYTKPLKILSWGCIIFLFCSGVGITLVLIIPSYFESSQNGCRETEGNDHHTTVLYILTAILIIGELALLALFIYPLKRNHKAAFTSKQPVCREGTGEVTSGESTISLDDKTHRKSTDHIIYASGKRFYNSIFSTQKKKTDTSKSHGFSKVRSCKTNKRIFRVMRRSVACASVCIVSDLLSFTLLTLLLPSDLVRSFRNSLHDINLMINFLTLVVSFGKYRYIISALICKPPNKLLKTEKGTYASSSSR